MSDLECAISCTNLKRSAKSNAKLLQLILMLNDDDSWNMEYLALGGETWCWPVGFVNISFVDDYTHFCVYM